MLQLGDGTVLFCGVDIPPRTSFKFTVQTSSAGTPLKQTGPKYSEFPKMALPSYLGEQMGKYRYVYNHQTIIESPLNLHLKS